jgi:hypothetical protein
MDATQERVAECVEADTIIMAMLVVDGRAGGWGIARALGLACYTETSGPDQPDQAT